jgi:hypothetical protein
MTVAFDGRDTFTAVKDSTDTTELSYTVMQLDGSETIRLPSTGSKILAEHAIGVVTLYNAYTKGAYTIAKNTALQTSDGKAYLTTASVVIPGYTMKGSVLTPGSIDVSARAVNAGESGNLSSGDITVSKLAKLPQAKKIYGRIKKEFTGGASGKVYTIPKSAADAAFVTLSDKLKASLTAKAKVQIPDGYIFYEGATLFTTDPSVQVSLSKEPDVPILLNGSFTAYLINQSLLINAIGTKSISQYNNEPITIPALQSLTLVPKNGLALSPYTDTTFDFSFSGSTDILWTIDTNQIQKILAGRKKSEFDAVIATMPGIEKAQVVIRPFWERSFPENPAKIGVTVAKPVAN